MGNKLSCSCAPLIKKAYRYEDSPWQAGARGVMGGSGGRRGDTGHLLRCGSLRERKRLWAEVFHVSASGAGTVKWQQVSEDLVPVNITCIQDSPECVFHITAYNSQVDKILDVRLVQPGTRIGQASECFVYWKDTMTNDTWGLNFTSPIDAKQFRECCSPSFKISRKASSSYSLKLEPPNKQKNKPRRKPLSTPASPSRSREPQCTCMTPEQFARLRNQEARYRGFSGTSTLPRTMARSTEMEMTPAREKITAATSSASLYDNVNNANATPGKTPKAAGESTKQKEKQNETCQTTPKTANVGIETVTVGSQIDSPEEKGASSISPKKSQKQSQDTSTQQNGGETLKSEGTQAGGTLQNKSLRKEQLHHTKSADYTDLEMQNGNIFNIVNNNHGGKKSKSKSTDDMRIENAQNGGISLDSNTLKRMLKPMSSIDSPVTSPEMTRKRHSHHSYHYHPSNNNQKYVMQETDNENYAHPYRAPPYTNKFQASRSVHDIGRQYAGGRGRTYLDSERNRCTGDVSPPSDNVIFDNQCYATTPSSSNGNSDMEQPTHCNSRRCNGGQTYQQQSMQSVSTPGSPTSRLLLEYEMHLRNTLAQGMDAESYSLRTFEALLTQSMENLEFAENIPSNVQRTPHVSRRRSVSNKSSTLPLSYRYCNERQNSKDRDGYYSDRNEIIREKRERDRERERERERERDIDRDRGYLSDYNSRCASCIGESARAQWFRHSDGWQSGSSTLGSGASSSINPSYSGHKRESPWDSLPSLRHEGSLNDSGYKSNRTDSLEQRGTFDRQDSVRSDYMSDRDGRYGIVQQASLESTDSRLCYLTSSEMSDDDRMSLTTAVSDDDDGESVINSPYRGKQTGTAAASFNCTGAVRKAGFLSVKKWLLRKKHQIELARKRGWKGYWVCLKGTTLLFYPCDSQESRAMEAAPKHLIIVDGAIMQPIPEHPKRDYIFCLSTAFGDAYLFQAPCQVELENWVNSIHSACAAAFARHRGKTGTLHLLQEEIFRLEKAIESDHKLKHMADLQQSVVSDAETKQQINNQIVQWEENLERLHCEQFRLRCYMASLQSGELPNPKSLLTHVSRATKQTLNKLGVFTVSSFHAFICARSPSLLNNLLAGRGATKRRPPLLSRSNSGSSRRSLQISSRDDEKTVKVCVPENQLVSVFLRDAMTVEEFLASACNRKNLNPMEHFVRVKKRRDMEDHNYFVPHRTDLIETYLHTHEIVEVCAKILYQVELQRNTLEQMWGFSVEAELIENSDRQDELCCYVSRVEDKSVAMQNDEGNQALQEFLQARNPRQQHSSTLESYLIKPIQRIVKYPLLLQQLGNLTDERSEERQHLIEAFKGMEKVAEHINEMQRIHEEYGAIFDHLFRQHQKSCKQPIDLSPGDLLYYGGVDWLNISDFLGKIKKGLELHAMCFVFKSAVVFLCKERLRQKKKLMGVSMKANSSEVEIIRYQVLIPVTEVQVRASSAKDMESHFLWELIHLRSQLQRRSEKVYVLSNSTTEFRNAFLRTIRQIIRESVRNMSIPSTRQNLSQPPITISPRMSTGHVEKFEKQTTSQGQSNGGNTTGGGVSVSVAPSVVTSSKKTVKPQLLPTSHNIKRKYSQSKQTMEHESSEDKDAEDSNTVNQQQTVFRSRSKTISDTSGEVKVEMDSGTKSEGEEDSQAFLGEKKANLGRTPNHLTLSTTSTISAGSTGSQARLIQSSHQPENYQPITVKELGSPIWKPRELPSLGESTTLPRKGKSASEFGDITSSHSASRKSLIEINNCAQQSNCNNHV
ncbi:guanine nucleotide exchange factor still life isoform X9 [Megachile rotundata]|uniref:guanine nucleotide exchange factor still life isoform X9 n=1 Tax=Megachile rotundata TaxID=143995 RepID=UPI003FD3BDD4